MAAFINAMRVLSDPAETGARCIALPQDAEGKSYAFPSCFFEKRVHRITQSMVIGEKPDDLAEIIAWQRLHLRLCQQNC